MSYITHTHTHTHTLTHLQTSEKRAVETTDVTKSFGWDSSEAWQQHDVQELCRVMFDALEKRFRKDGYEQPNLINDLYQGSWKDYVKCLEVKGHCVYMILVASLSMIISLTIVCIATCGHAFYSPDRIYLLSLYVHVFCMVSRCCDL